jgi:putative nucleotidyltransferase with HDIG domain/PAS domain S-box-containing protein
MQSKTPLLSSEERLRTTLDALRDGALIIGFDWRYLYANEAAAAQSRKPRHELLGATLQTLFPGIEQTPLFAVLQTCMTQRVAQRLENEFRFPDGSSGWFDLSIQPVPEGLFILSEDNTERRRSEGLRQALLEIMQGLAVTDDLKAFLALVHQAVAKMMYAENFFVTLHDPDSGLFEEVYSVDQFDPPAAPSRLEKSVSAYVFHTGQPLLLTQQRFDELVARGDVALVGTNSPSWLGVPLKTSKGTLGVMVVQDYQREQRYSEGHVELLASMASQVALAVQRRQAEAQVQRQLERLAALRAIDSAITGNLDLQVTLRVLLEQLEEQLGTHAADVLLLDARSRALTYVAGRGFWSTDFQNTRVQLGEGRAGRAALERRIVVETNPQAAHPPSRRTDLLGQDRFVSYFGVPLIARGQVLGVLELFHRAPLRPTAEWLGFLEALAGQAAIAIENAALYADLQQSNAELSQAYDETIAGWSAALDLRDKETEGHSQRVAEVTLRLARAAGMDADALVHVRRGALLHDIGKMGIPDRILLKPDPLTPDEWAIMQQHPTFAYQLLSPIAHLRPALDIPYCHHEKWDGTGYPRGLTGTDIPLAARLFAVADVWDALCSNRPYRPALKTNYVREYIRSQSGAHFDPDAVSLFFELGWPPGS